MFGTIDQTVGEHGWISLCSTILVYEIARRKQRVQRQREETGEVVRAITNGSCAVTQRRLRLGMLEIGGFAA